jgi:predicted Abi (CAAX) family protease
MSSRATRIYVGTKDSDPRWKGRIVKVLARSTGPGPRNALVEFDTGERVVVPTYFGGVGATLRIPRPATTKGRPGATHS